MDTLTWVRKFVREDSQKILNVLSENGISAKCIGIRVNATSDILDNSNKDDVEFTATLNFLAADKKFQVELTYLYSADGELYSSDDDREYEATELVKKIKAITSSRSMGNKKRIVAAEEDEFFSDDDFTDADPTSATSEETTPTENDDALPADTEMKEDDSNIETDNNIANHYIAECDKCGGIFISSISLSDQPITSISGICPLCEEETEQFLKWVIKPVEDVTE